MVRSCGSAIGVGALLVCVACADEAAPSPGAAESEASAANEFEVALSGHAIDAREVLGTYDLVNGQAETRRLILLPGGSALGCATPSACRPVETPPNRRQPFFVVEAGAHRTRYLVLRTSSTDPTPAHVYALEPGGADDVWGFREVKRPGTSAATSVQMRRLPCSETMYDESDDERACGFYRCKLERAPSPSQRCEYFSGFGLPYCKKYFHSNFDDRRFGPRVRQCLQEVLRDTSEGMSCDAVEDAAIRSHVDCYVAAGYCSLSLADRFRIAREIEPEDLNLDIGKTLARIEKSCLDVRPEDG